MLAALVVLALALALGWLRVRLAPAPSYDWPVWAYRVWLAVRALTRRSRRATVRSTLSRGGRLWVAARVPGWRRSAWWG
jgi:hypothetical protein